MKLIIFGLGSIGVRHTQNLRALLPDAMIIAADPASVNMSIVGDMMGETVIVSDWLSALAAHPDADAAIIASPTECHAEQMMVLFQHGIPFYVEKPMMGLGDQMSISESSGNTRRRRCTVGYQYRFHPVYREAAPIIRRHGYVRFAASENLLARYGPDCLSVIAAHPIDTALWLLGPARDVDMETDGLRVYGTIHHENGLSEHDYRINIEPRVSLVASGDDLWSLDSTNDMYLDALRAWLAWVNGAPRDERTAALADGLASMQVMEQVKRKETVQC